MSSKLEDTQAILMVFEKKDSLWTPVHKPIAARIGRNGFATAKAKKEGDGKTPMGIYSLGQLFCYLPPQTDMPFLQTNEDDKWIDDPNSEQYNQYVRGNSQAQSYENLKRIDDAYKYCLVIEYNTKPTVRGKGSAIFFHLTDFSNPTAGCVAIAEKDMEWILRWMKPNFYPVFLMGTEEFLTQKNSR